MLRTLVSLFLVNSTLALFHAKNKPHQLSVDEAPTLSASLSGASLLTARVKVNK